MKLDVPGDAAAPPGYAFAEALAQALLAGKRFDIDTDAAQDVYGGLADAFLQRAWEEPLLRKAARSTVLAAAAAAS